VGGAVNHDLARIPTRVAELVATYGLAAFVLTLPLEFTGEALHFQLSRIVLLVTAVACAYLVVVGRRELVVPRLPSVYLLVLYLAASLADWLITRAPGSSSAVLDAVLYPVVGLLIVNLVLSEADHRRAWVALLVSGLVVAVLGGILYVTHVQIWTPNPEVANRMNITFGDPNITARFLTVCACAAVIMFAARQGPVWPAAAAAIACAVVTPLTFSRSGLVLFILCVSIAIVVSLDRRRAAAIGVAALIAFVLSTGLNPETRQRAEDAALTAASVVSGDVAGHHGLGSAGHHQAAIASDDNRRYLVAAGMKMALDHPLLGVGFGGYQHALLTTYRGFLPARYTDSVSHTSFVTVIAEQGIVGALLVAAFVIQLAREALAARNRRDAWSLWAAIPAALIIPIFLYSQFEGRFFQEPYLWLALGMLYSAQVLAQRSAIRFRRQPTALARAA
jgi:putative inorganic carbon (HCO3(-)) transporter